MKDGRASQLYSSRDVLFTKPSFEIFPGVKNFIFQPKEQTQNALFLCKDSFSPSLLSKIVAQAVQL
jgi:hypothetical protein